MQVISFILVIGILLVFIYGSIMFDLELGNYYVGEGFTDGAYVRTDLDGIKAESPFKSSHFLLLLAAILMMLRTARTNPSASFTLEPTNWRLRKLMELMAFKQM